MADAFVPSEAVVGGKALIDYAATQRLLTPKQCAALLLVLSLGNDLPADETESQALADACRSSSVEFFERVTARIVAKEDVVWRDTPFAPSERFLGAKALLDYGMKTRLLEADQESGLMYALLMGYGLSASSGTLKLLMKHPQCCAYSKEFYRRVKARVDGAREQS